MNSTFFYRSYQQGYAVLMTSVIILMVTSIIALYSVRSSIAEEKISANDYKIRTAFEAADAGIEFGMAYLKENKNAIVVDTNNDGYIDTYSNSAITNVALANSTHYTISYTNPVVSNFYLFQITSIGKSADGVITRTVSQLLDLSSFLKAAPPASLTAKNKVNLSGNLGIENTNNGLTIWSGEGTILGGAAHTTGTGGVTSDKNGINSDIVHDDANLSSMTSDQFFQSFFGTTKAEAEQNANIAYTNSGNTNYSSLLDNVTGKVIWINQTGGDAVINSNTTIGSATDPVIMIVNGNLSVNGKLKIYGLLYVTNGTDNWVNNGGGTLQVYGAVAVAGNVQSTGTPDVTYDPNVLDKSKKLGEFVKVPGTWRDF